MWGIDDIYEHEDEDEDTKKDYAKKKDYELLQVVWHGVVLTIGYSCIPLNAERIIPWEGSEKKKIVQTHIGLVSLFGTRRILNGWHRSINEILKKEKKYT